MGVRAREFPAPPAPPTLHIEVCLWPLSFNIGPGMRRVGERLRKPRVIALMAGPGPFANLRWRNFKPPRHHVLRIPAERRSPRNFDPLRKIPNDAQIIERGEPKESTSPPLRHYPSLLRMHAPARSPSTSFPHETRAPSVGAHRATRRSRANEQAGISCPFRRDVRRVLSPIIADAVSAVHGRYGSPALQ